VGILGIEFRLFCVTRIRSEHWRKNEATCASVLNTRAGSVVVHNYRLAFRADFMSGRESEAPWPDALFKYAPGLAPKLNTTNRRNDRGWPRPNGSRCTPVRLRNGAVSRHSFESVTAQATQARVQSQTAFMRSLDDLKDGRPFCRFHHYRCP
jgi:hypothetical protein